MFQVDRASALERPTLTYDQIYGSARSGFLADPFQPCLMESSEFLKLFEHVYRLKVTRRNLQLYSSPAYRFIPLPIHKGGYKSYYLNPEHTVRLAVALHLQKRHYFPAKAIRKVMQVLPEDQYRFILEDVLTGSEVLELASMVQQGYGPRDALYFKVCRVLDSIENPYWKAVEKFGKGADEQHQKYVEQELVRETKRVADWIRSGTYARVGRKFWGRTEKESHEYISWVHAIRDKAGAA